VDSGAAEGGNDGGGKTQVDALDFEWAKRAGGLSNEEDADRPWRMDVLEDGTFFVTGVFRELATFGFGEKDRTEIASAGGLDVFLAAYDADGELRWVVSAGGAGEDSGYGVSCMQDGSCVITGEFTLSAVFGANGDNQTTLDTGGSGTGMFAAAYGPDGSLKWAKSASSTEQAAGKGVALTDDGSVIVTGTFSGSAVFGPDADNETALDSAGSTDIFVAAFDSDGAFMWAQGAGGSGDDAAEDITATDDGRVIITGSIDTKAVFGTGEFDTPGDDGIFLASFSSGGQIEWVRTAGGPREEYEYEGVNSGLAVTRAQGGGAYVTGTFRDTSVFGQGEAHETVLESETYGVSGMVVSDFFTAKYDNDGKLEWAKQGGGDEYDYARGIAAFSDGSVVITGFYDSHDICFEKGTPSEQCLSSILRGGSFIAKYSSGGSFEWALRIAGADSLASQDIAVFDDKVIISGRFWWNLIFGQDDADRVSLSAKGSNDMFAAGYRLK